MFYSKKYFCESMFTKNKNFLKKEAEQLTKEELLSLQAMHGTTTGEDMLYVLVKNPAMSSITTTI